MAPFAGVCITSPLNKSIWRWREDKKFNWVSILRGSKCDGNLIALIGLHIFRKWNYLVKILIPFIDQGVGSCENTIYIYIYIHIFLSCGTKSWERHNPPIWLGKVPPRKGKSEAKYCRTPPGEAKRLPDQGGELVGTFNCSKCWDGFLYRGWYSIPKGYSSSLWFLQHADRSFKTPLVFTALQLQFHMLCELLAKFRSQLQWLNKTSSTPNNLYKRFSFHKWFLRKASDQVKQIRSKLHQATISRTQMPHCLEERDAVSFLTLSWLAQKDTSLKHVGRLLMVFWHTGAFL